VSRLADKGRNGDWREGEGDIIRLAARHGWQAVFHPDLFRGEFPPELRNSPGYSWILDSRRCAARLAPPATPIPPPHSG
jgi:hypothetical protein